MKKPTGYRDCNDTPIMFGDNIMEFGRYRVKVTPGVVKCWDEMENGHAHTNENTEVKKRQACRPSIAQPVTPDPPTVGVGWGVPAVEQTFVGTHHVNMPWWTASDFTDTVTTTRTTAVRDYYADAFSYITTALEEHRAERAGR